MICSNCSKPFQPVVVLDIDGTLGDYHTHLIGYAAHWLYGRERGHDFLHTAAEIPYDGSRPFRDWFCDTFSIDLATFRAMKLAFRQGGMKRWMPMFSGAEILVNSLREFAEVWLATARPHDRYDRVDPDTRAWLEFNGLRFDGLVYSDDKMPEIARHVDPDRVCFVLDDLVENLESAERLFGTGVAVLRRNSYNSGVSWPVAVSDLLDARAMATAHIQDWTVAHAFADLPTTTEGV